MPVLICYPIRRRLGAYVDQALSEPEGRRVSRHLDRCVACRAELESLARLKTVLRSGALRREPDWTGFWPGIVRGIEATKHATGIRPVRRPAWRPRVALASAMIAGLLALTIWQAVEPPIPEYGEGVQMAQTDYQGGSVMVYTPADEDMTVIWIFGADRAGGGTL